MTENSDRSQAWEQPEFEPLWRDNATLWGRGDSCPYNLRSSDGKLMRKTRMWVTNNADLLEAVTKRCDRTHTHAEV